MFPIMDYGRLEGFKATAMNSTVGLMASTVSEFDLHLLSMERSSGRSRELGVQMQTP